MAKLLKHVALISESELVSANDLMAVAAALQKQATRDLSPIWDIGATVDAFGRLEDMPVDYWPIIIRDDIGYDAAGIHLDRNGQPFSLVSSDGSRDVWSLTCSHELCEMLVDPFGDRLVAGDSIKPGQGRVNYLVEVCDPSEGSRYAYSVNGVRVSDFYTPHFFDPVASPGVRYSYTGAIVRPRTILRDGYVSWVDLATNIWWQQVWFGTARPKFRNLGKLSGTGSLRSQVDRITSEATAQAMSAGRKASLMAGQPMASADEAAGTRAAALHELIGTLISGA
jgi:hypothetical protein